MKPGNFGGFDIVQNSKGDILTIRINNRGESYKPFIGDNEVSGEPMILCLTKENIEDVKTEMLGAIEILDKLLKD